MAEITLLDDKEADTEAAEDERVRYLVTDVYFQPPGRRGLVFSALDMSWVQILPSCLLHCRPAFIS